MAELPIEAWEPDPFPAATPPPEYTPTADNDLWTGRITLTGHSGSVTGIDLSTATALETGEADWYSYDPNTRWYVFEAPTTGTYRFELSSASTPGWAWGVSLWQNTGVAPDFDADYVDWLYDGYTDIDMAAGEHYLVAVFEDYGEPTPSDVVLTYTRVVDGVPAQTNDAFANRTAVSSIPTGLVEHHFYNLAGFGVEGDEAGQPHSRSAWYSFGANKRYAGAGSPLNSTADHGGMTVSLDGAGTITVWELPLTTYGQTEVGCVAAHGGLAGIMAMTPHAQGTGQLRFDTRPGSTFYLVRVSSDSEAAGRLAVRWPFPGQNDTTAEDIGIWTEFTATETGWQIGKKLWFPSQAGVSVASGVGASPSKSWRSDTGYGTEAIGSRHAGYDYSTPVGVTMKKESQHYATFDAVPSVNAWNATSATHSSKRMTRDGVDADVGDGIDPGLWYGRTNEYNGYGSPTGWRYAQLALFTFADTAQRARFTSGVVSASAFQDAPTGTDLQTADVTGWNYRLFEEDGIIIGVWGDKRLDTGGTEDDWIGYDIQATHGKVALEMDVPEWRTKVSYLVSGAWEPPATPGEDPVFWGFPENWFGFDDWWTGVEWPGVDWDDDFGLGFDQLTPEVVYIRAAGVARATAKAKMTLPLADPLSAPDFPDPWAGEGNDATQVPAGQGIRQELWVEFTVAPYLVARGQALLRGRGAFNASSAGRGASTLDTVRKTPDQVTPGLQYRWYAAAGYTDAAAVQDWDSQTANALAWAGANTLLPAEPVTYETYPGSSLTRTALSFGGTQWLSKGVETAAKMTASLVLRPHPGEGPFFGLLESNSPEDRDTDPQAAEVLDIGLRFAQDTVLVQLPMRVLRFPVRELLGGSTAPIVVTLSLDTEAHLGRLHVVGRGRQSQSFQLPTGVTSIDAELLLGRPGGRENEAVMAVMELFEVNLDLTQALDYDAMDDLAAMMSHVYGITG